MNTQRISGWGRFPTVDARLVHPRSNEEAGRCVTDTTSLIAQGLARSYGDASLAEDICRTTGLDCALAFDSNRGTIECQAGISLDRILQLVVPRGWFLAVTPGTRFVTVGGAIAADVHGKNHHHDGCFSSAVERIELLTANGNIVTCSRESHAPLFHATCGGMGLTGVIVAATLRLRRIGSTSINQTTIKAPNLDAVLEVFAEHENDRYSVAWIDCAATGPRMGRSLVMLGDHANAGSLEPHREGGFSLPFDLPRQLLNGLSVRAFNTLYYERIRHPRTTSTVHYAPFFYPLDSIRQWNRLYGSRGFTQYQFVIPRAAGIAGLEEILQLISASGRGSFLAVLKSMGPANDNPLSFPIDGYTLALDFKYDLAVFPLLEELDRRVLANGGRIYLAKDARMSAQTFRASYRDWEAFQSVREQWGALGKFASLQSRRLGLDT